MIVQYPPIYIVAENNQANGGNNRFVYGVKRMEQKYMTTGIAA